MECFCYECIYNENYSCILENIEITENGLCDSCQVVVVPKEIIDLLKEQRIRKTITLSEDL